MAALSASPRFTHYPLLWLGVCFAAGIFGANYFPSPYAVLVAICTASAIFAAHFINRDFSFVFLSIAFVAAGFLIFQIEKDGVSENRLKRIYDEGRIESGEPVEIEGIVLGKPEPAFNGFFFKIKSELIVYNGARQSVSGTLRLFAPVQSEEAAVEYDRLDLQHGSRIRVD